MQNIRAITLDLDDTLWDIGPVIRRAEAELWRWFETHYPRVADTYTQESALALRQAVAKQHPHKAHDFSFLRRKVLVAMATGAGYDASIADTAFEVFQRWRNSVELFADVQPALQKLQSRYRIIAVTNGNACLGQIGIDGYFDGFVNAAGAGAAKPSARIFDRAVAAAGVTAAEVLHVGDHPDLDVVGAAAAGLRTAWMNRLGAAWPAGLSRPDAEISDMLELDAVLVNARHG